MIDVRQAKLRAKDLLLKKAPAWVTGKEEAVFRLALHPPTEKEALSDLPAWRSWQGQWLDLENGHMRVESAPRKWGSIGVKTVPVRLIIEGGQAIARFAGQKAIWDKWKARFGIVADVFGDSPDVKAAFCGCAKDLFEASEVEFKQILDVSLWLIENEVTGYTPRQVPIRGVDSKWIETHKRAVTAFVSKLKGQAGLGLISADRNLVRIRSLDPVVRVGELNEFAATLGELSRLTWQPRAAIIVENLDTFVSLPNAAECLFFRGVVAVWGRGFAVSGLESIPWLKKAQCWYWGDLDSHGFAILNRLRSHLPDVKSVLMDMQTLNENEDLAVVEPAPTKSDFQYLTASENNALELLREKGNLRLEQERIPFDYALTNLENILQ